MPDPNTIFSLQRKLTTLALMQLLSSIMLTKFELESGNSGFGLILFLEVVLTVLPLFLSNYVGLRRFAEDEYFKEFGESELYKILFTENILGKILGFAIFGNLEIFGVNKSESHILLNFCAYLALFCVYHNGEFMFVLWCHPKELSWHSKYPADSNFELNFLQFFP